MNSAGEVKTLNLTLVEAALLNGLFQNPSHENEIDGEEIAESLQKQAANPNEVIFDIEPIAEIRGESLNAESARLNEKELVRAREIGAFIKSLPQTELEKLARGLARIPANLSLESESGPDLRGPRAAYFSNSRKFSDDERTMSLKALGVKSTDYCNAGEVKFCAPGSAQLILGIDDNQTLSALLVWSGRLGVSQRENETRSAVITIKEEENLFRGDLSENSPRKPCEAHQHPVSSADGQKLQKTDKFH